MERHYTFRYRLEPTATQEAAFWSYAGCCRFVYNCALEWAETAWRMWVARGSRPQDKPRIDWRALAGELPVSRGPGKVDDDDLLAWMVDCPKHLLQQTLIDFGRAWVNFWEGRAGHPRPHRKWRHDSFRVPEAKSVRFSPEFDKHVGLPKVGRVRMSVSKRSAKSYGVKYGRPYRGVLKSATVSYERGVWWISLCCVETIPDVDVWGPEVGVDMGVTKPLTLSTGEVMDLAVALVRRPGAQGATRSCCVETQTRFAQPSQGPGAATTFRRENDEQEDGRGAQDDDEPDQEPRQDRRRGPEGRQHDTTRTK